MARILALSSHVVRGSVGLAATVPALQSLGHEVWALPTVTLAARPGLGAAATKASGRRAASAKELTGMLNALEQDGCWPMLDAVFTGYFASPEAVAAVAAAVTRIKKMKPGVRVLVDPIIGDAGRLYVPEATAKAIRDELLPLADITTPNLFELEWLTSARKPLVDTDAIAKATRKLGVASVVVTSAKVTETEITTLLVTPAAVREVTSARLADIPNGSGDLLDGLMLGHLLEGRTESAAVRGAVRNLARVLEASVGRDVLQLGVLNFP
jgi:pyridoxine kinase